jgi:ABC-type glutathione transport system ATPase component
LQQVHVSFKVAHHLWGKTPTYFNAVNNASFQLLQGKTLGLIGESGSGKSTIARAIMALVPVQSGQIHVMGKQVLYNNALHLKALRKQVQLIFQDPFSSLNPRHTIGYILSEPMVVHRLVPKAQQQHEVEKILDMVQLPKDALKRYPHQFSGGQRQRIGIARALAMQAKILICDESLAALDVSVQAQLMNLLKSLQQELQLSYLFISHDLAIVYYMSDTIMVMHKGNIVEQGDAATIFRNPQHVYTQKLLNAATYAS